jgi:Fur family ferric uptake transcriptional regulator
LKRTDENWAEGARTALSDAGFRRGGARSRVLELLAGESCALSALELDRRLPEVGRATVYRSLEQLEQLGLVRRVDLGGDAACYERVDPGGEHHHHIVCRRCGRVAPFEDPKLERAIDALAERSDFTISSHEVTLRGECAACGGR